MTPQESQHKDEDKERDDDMVVDLGDEVDAPADTTLMTGAAHLPQRILQSVGAAVLLFLAIFVTVTVILRYFGHGVLGAVEIAALGMVVITVMVIPAVTLADENFRVEVADFFVSVKTLNKLEVLSIAIQILVSVFLAAAAIDLLIHDISTRTTMAGELSLERWLLSLPVAIGFIGTVYSTVLVAMRHRRKPTTTTVSEG